jgi:hypothetical protein
MATNPFEQFVDSEPARNPFAQFVQPESEANPFAQFVKPEPTPEEQSGFRQVADIPLKLGAGAVQGVRMIADAFGAGSNVSKTLKGAEDWIAALYSAQAKQDSREIARIMKEAEDKGATDQISAALKAFSVAPIDLVSQGLGTAAPAILASLAAVVAGAPTAVGTAATLGVGALMGAGTVKGTIYDAVKEELAKTDMPADQIEARARLAQEYGGENLDMILTGAAIGGISARTGLEGSIARATASRIMGKAAAAEAAETAAKERAAQATAQVAARGPLRQGVRTAGVESGTEFIQAGQEQIAENIALQREGFDVPTFRGAVGAGALEALVGGPLGAGFGAREARIARQEQARLQETQADAAELERLRQQGIEQAAETTEDGLPPSDLAFDDRVAALSQQYQDAMPREQADALARQMILDQDEALKTKTTPPAAPPAPSTEATPDPQRIQKITEDLVEVGVPLEEARAEALALATEEAQQVRGASDVRRPISTAGGESISVAAQPDVTTATGRPPTVKPDGVVSTAADVGVPAAGEGIAPGAVIDPALEKLKADLPTMTDKQLEDLKISDLIGMESPEASGLIRTEIKRRSQEGVPSGTQAPQTVETKEAGAAAPSEGAAVAVKPSTTAAAPSTETAAGVAPLLLADTLANSAFTTRAEQTGEDNFDRLERSIGERRYELESKLSDAQATPSVISAALTKFDEAVKELRKAEKFNPIQFARAQAQTSFDNRNNPDYGSNEEEVFDLGADNVNDTLQEYGVKSGYIFDNARAAYRNEIARLQAAAPAPAAPAPSAEAPKKRGPKGPRLTEEQRAAKAEERKTTNAENMRNARALQAAEKQLDAALTPLDKGTFENEAALNEAREDKKVARRAAVETIFALRQKAGPKSQRDFAELLLKKAGVTEAERTAIKDAATRRKKALEAAKDLVQGEVTVSRSGKTTAKNVGKPIAAFSKFTTGLQALNYVAKTGSPFFKLVANRIRPFVKDVEFVVLEKGDVLPSPLQQVEADWNRARGIFISYYKKDASGNLKEFRAVYVRGASFGVDQGVNNIIVLHELLHAATTNRIVNGQIAVASGDLDSDVAKTTIELRKLARYAGAMYSKLELLGMVPPELRRVVQATTETDGGDVPSYNIFDDLREFVAYGMSDPYMQDFLLKLKGFTPAKSMFGQFVDGVRKFFGIPSSDSRAMLDLVNITDKLLDVDLVVSDQVLDKNVEEVMQRIGSISKAAKTKTKKVNATLKKIERSREGTEAQNTLWSGISSLVKDRDSTLFTDVLTARWTAFSSASFRQLLPMIQTDVLAEWSKRLGLTKLADAYKLLVDMSATRVAMTARAAPISDALLELQGKKPAQYTALADVMHYSTLLGKDPTKVTSDKDLNDMWGALEPSTKKLYERVRNYYASNYDLYHKTLIDRVNNSGISGSASDPISPKGKLIANIKLMYEKGKDNGPYFPLMRYGQYWLRIGKGKSGEFYMFESESDREVFLRKHMRTQTRSYEQMAADGDIDKGNDIRGARKDIAGLSDLIKNVFTTIEEAAGKPVLVTDDYGNLTNKYSTIDPEKLKDEIYQMYLHTLPEKNFRRHFIHRQGKTGFSADISRNFATTSTNMINQLARLQYASRILDTVEAQKDILKNNPDKPKLNEFVTEMRIRAEREAYPDPDNTFLSKLADSATKMSFLWMMSTVKTAVAQFSAIPVFAAPVLASRHGVAATAREMGRFLNVFNQMGVLRSAPDGSTSYTMPSVLYSKEVQSDPEQLRAAQYMMDRGISETTLAYDLGNRRKVPTHEQQSAFRKTVGAATNAMTGLFHHSERLIREVTFMSAFRLNREKMPNATFEEVAARAEDDTYTALANFSAINRPRGIGALGDRSVVLDAHKPLGRAILQFKMFPAFVTTYFVRNFYRMVWSNPNVTKEERAQAAGQFFGTLAMSFSIAGVMGIPGFSFALGILSGLRNMMLGEDDEDPLAKRDLEFWFRNVWLPETFGNVKIGNRSLDELLDRGLVAAITGYDISSSLSLNNMWFPEMKEQATAEAAMKDYLFSLGGPSVSLAVSQFPRAIDLFRQGKLVQGTEQLLPGLLRAPLTAYRYSQEGATTAAGAIIKDKEEFTIGQLIGQSMGFATEGLVAQREAIFKANALMMQVKNERKALLARLDLETRTEDGDVGKILDDITKYNAKNFFDPITGEAISESLRNRLKRRLVTERGIPIDKKYYPQLIDLVNPGTVKLEREAEAARK